jgi:hypothetical protein
MVRGTARVVRPYHWALYNRALYNGKLWAGLLPQHMLNVVRGDLGWVSLASTYFVDLFAWGKLNR